MGDATEGEEIPLQRSWTMWHATPCAHNATAAEYEDAQKIVCTFNTVQGFWRGFGQLPSVDELPLKASLHMMVTGVKPLWEDPFNHDGGIWTFRVNKEESPVAWKELLLACIGEQFSDVVDESDGDGICGVTVSTRFHDNIVEIWNRRADGKIEQLRDAIKGVLPSISFRNVFYKPMNAHDSFGKGASTDRGGRGKRG